jgi:hypothetical protein
MHLFSVLNLKINTDLLHSHLNHLHTKIRIAIALFPLVSIKNDHEATLLHREHEETNSKNSI